MKICVLQPDYSRSDIDYGNYDPSRNLTAILAPHEVHHVAINKLTTFRQLRDLSKQGFDLYVNLIEGYLDWDIPSIDVVHSLDRLGLPYTGPNAELYDPPKVLMKYIAHISGVKTSPHVVVTSLDQVEQVARTLTFPLFVKPAHAGDSLGIDARSRVWTVDELRAKVAETLPDYPELLVEQYIDGRELTCLVISDPEAHGQVRAFRPVEWVFDSEPRFKTYAHKTSELHPDANVPVTDEGLVRQLQQAAIDVFNGFNAVGYARMDFRLDGNGDLYFLEVNFSCSIFYADGYEGSADYILKHDGIGQAGFAKLMVAEGIARHRRRVRPFRIEGSPIAGYGIHATRPITKGEIVFHGEERAQRIVTRGHVERTWSASELESFRHYAYPVSEEVFVLWDSNPSEWAPQNHSCDPNTEFFGLDVVARRDIAPGDELTLDFATLLGETSASFQCNCGSPVCRGVVSGTPGNSVTLRERRRRGD
ncbi:MAG TPA: SET domain-containing protein-lysine N-methyltransferase [Gemmatimonadaceae bacterium]|nr:SET domain-containing protein-lysine N-methyltransferase [Gemmatimonadaceae bacterium]HPV73279.1 SET domain-containing protein-lysine N-methyltransferase [Gemmatimonadaceae bacterium]